MKGEGVNVLLSPGFLLAILNICSKNQANVVFIAKSGSKSFISCLCSLVVAKEFLDAKANTSVVIKRLLLIRRHSLSKATSFSNFLSQFLRQCGAPRGVTG